MPVSQATIETGRPGRYLIQFCRHAAAMGSGAHLARLRQHAGPADHGVQVTSDWSDDRGAVTFDPWGRCEMTAGENTLTVRVDAVDEDGLQRIQDIVTRNLDRFSRRDPLTVTWHRLELPDPDHAPSPRAAGPAAALRQSGAAGWLRAHRSTLVIALAVLLVAGVHLGLAGTLVARSRWTGIATNTVLAVALLKVGFIIAVRAGLSPQGMRRLLSRRHVSPPPGVHTDPATDVGPERHAELSHRRRV